MYKHQQCQLKLLHKEQYGKFFIDLILQNTKISTHGQKGIKPGPTKMNLIFLLEMKFEMLELQKWDTYCQKESILYFSESPLKCCNSPKTEKTFT